MKKKSNIPGNCLSAEKISNLLNLIRNEGPLLSSKKAAAGFDGFIDSIVKIIKSKHEQKPLSLFNTIKEYGNYVTKKAGTNFSLELQQLEIKPGGNMPIMSNALARLGMRVNCVGALGYPQIHPVFSNLSSGCQLHSFTNPGTSMAFEFHDGKIFHAQMGALHTLGWDQIKEVIGTDILVKLFEESDLLCVLNWGEIDASTEIWKGLLKDVLPNYTGSTKKRIVFFDLSDCSKRSNEAVMEALKLLEEFGRYAEVILSLNKNEARRIFTILYKRQIESDMKSLGEKIFKKIKIETLLLHSSREAIAFNRKGIFPCQTFFLTNPKISTGAGDNFNAGFAAAHLLQSDLEYSVIFANAVSGYYVQTGVSPQLDDLADFFEVYGKMAS